MIPFSLHRRIPLVRRPFYQRDKAIAERDALLAVRDRGAGPSLCEIAQQTYSGDVGTKKPDYYQRYDTFFRNNYFRPTAILEVGVHRGESTKVFATAYPEAKIVALDLNRYDDVDFSGFPNVVYLQADQSDRPRLATILDREFPSGFDLVIDDASHIGAYSRATFDAVFPRLTPGGIYIIEDWGTGYFDDFVDGGRFQDYPLSFRDGNIPRRLPSHDFGMVGFVKSLVDMTSEPDIRTRISDPATHKSRLEKLEFSEAVCIALKARQIG
ncbi:MAG: class I SAM-dependent methyltransferase [Acetobacteraceae bacterium]